MSTNVDSTADSPDLEALFDSIVQANAAPDPVDTNAANDAGANAAEVIARVGHMTRALHDSLRALGFDKKLESAAAAVPDARDRLAYVAKMTEQAASRALNATECARPIQEKLARDADELAARWDGLFEQKPGVDAFKALVANTREFLRAVPARAQATNAQLTEVMMAQEFQDLTGQVLKKVADVTHDLENQLLQLLVENAAPERREEASGLLNGPLVNAAGRADSVAGQEQVDQLLESLGF
jgi:chemotaxis protein CheZ